MSQPNYLQRRRSRRGAAAVEFAVVLPLFLLIIFGIVEFGRAFMVQHLLAEGARMGARRAIIDGSSNSQVEQAVKDHCADSLGINSNQVVVAISAEQGGSSSGANLSDATAGDMCVITVSVAFDDVDFIPGSFLGGTQLIKTCAMEHE